MASDASRSWALLWALSLITLPTLGSARVIDPCKDGGRLTPAVGADGIGGTGVSGGDPDEGGIGGTGIAPAADSGVVGVVTGFASICVGGREIHYDAAVRVSIDGVPSDARSLAVGQIVEVAAKGSNAIRIGIRHEIEGEITAVAAASNRLTVLGQSVALTPSTWSEFDGGPGLAEANMFRAGDLVRIAGFRDHDDEIVASRVELIKQATPALRGTVEEVGSGFVVVSGLELRAPGASARRVGDSVRATGVIWNGSVLDARTLVNEPSLPFDGHIENLSIEGIVRRGGNRADVTLDGLHLDATRTAEPLPNGQRVRVDAKIREGRIVAERIEPIRALVPDRPSGLRQGPAVGPPQKSARPKALPPAAAPRPNAASRPARVERPPRPERPERPERPLRPERPARPERPIRPLLPRPR